MVDTFKPVEPKKRLGHIEAEVIIAMFELLFDLATPPFQQRATLGKG